MKNIFYNIFGKINFFILAIKRNKKYHLNKNQIGINLGCELETIPEFKGVDGSYLIFLMQSKIIPSVVKKIIYSQTCSSNHFSFKDYYLKLNKLNIIHYNLCYGLPFKENSINYIFSSHFFEHLNRKEGIKLFEECYKVLRKEGKIRICVPDLNIEARKMEKDLKIYFKTKDIEILQKYLTINFKNKNYYSFHKRMYNFEELKIILLNIGFKEIKKLKLGEGDFPFIKKLDFRKGLIIQAKK